MIGASVRDTPCYLCILFTAVYRAVLPDLDRTLQDTLKDVADSTSAALVRLGYLSHDTVDQHRLY